MKRILTIAIILLLPVVVTKAQYVPNSNQGYQFASTYNPAFTGVEPYNDLKLGYRHQWTGFGADAPKFVNATFNFRLNQPADPRQNALRTSVPVSKTRMPKKKLIIHGMGVNLFNEKVGVIDRMGGGLNYAFHYPLTQRKNIWIATGVSAIFEHTRVDIDEIYMGVNPDPDPFYEKLLATGANRTDMNVRAGVLFYSPAFYLGFSYFPVFNAALQTSEGDFSDSFYRGSFQTGLSLPLGRSFDLRPSVLGILQTDDELLIDYSMKIFFQERIWLGATYRGTKSGAGLIGFNLNKMLGATYSYEVPTSSLRQFSDGSHELVLSFRLNNYKNYTPYVW